jgi:hypothetical protein
MRWFGLVSVTLLTACGAAEVQSQKLKDGSWQFTCQLSMDECVRRVQDQCKNQRFRILEGTSETRLRDAPPFERAYHTSHLHLTCTDDGATVLVSTQAPSGASATPASKICSAGETRACVGPAACKGGQACLADGGAFGPCDCGPPPAPPPPAIDATPPAVTPPSDSLPTPASSAATPPAAPTATPQR